MVTASWPDQHPASFNAFIAQKGRTKTCQNSFSFAVGFCPA
jgi:hypothetical protein